MFTSFEGNGRRVHKGFELHFLEFHVIIVGAIFRRSQGHLPFLCATVGFVFVRLEKMLFALVDQDQRFTCHEIVRFSIFIFSPFLCQVIFKQKITSETTWHSNILNAENNKVSSLSIAREISPKRSE